MSAQDANLRQVQFQESQEEPDCQREWAPEVNGPEKLRV